MKINNIKNKIIFLTIIFIVGVNCIMCICNFEVYAADAIDYDFTDELEQDRAGIGFLWTSEDKTLKITEIKNNSAIIKLPNNSTIDIQGNIENTIKGLICEGDLVVKGNNIASLNIIGCSCTTPIGYLSSVYVYDNLFIEKGNMKIVSNGIGYSMSQLTYAGLYCKNIIINDGDFEINIGGLRSGSQILYAIYNNEKIILNDGTIRIKAEEGTGIRGKSEINGGCIELITGKTHNAFKEVPSINPLIDWEISYSTENEIEKINADITDIYNIYNSPVITIFRKVKIGDINCDQKINGKDWNMMYEYINETKELTKYQLLCADVNNDGKVNGKDWNRLYEHITEVNLLFQ